ncbi:MAG TPA: DsrE family protein [Symbiobacteriaceae bacterium]|nr:DsrE family protein [Symbiobacteriaceae bacterium]
MENKVIVLRNEGMGQGDDTLGQVILANFLRMLQQVPEKPKAIFLYNGAVKLLVEGSPVLSHFQELEAMGVPVQVCKTCVESFGIREALRAGQVSTTAQLVEYVQTCEIVTL